MAESRDTCPFCSIDPKRWIASSDAAIAFLDGFPIAEHHTLVIPQRHVASLFDLDVSEQAEVWRLASEVRHRLADEFGIEAFNIGVNDGVPAGQTVLHAHVHVIPRVTGDSDDPRGGIRWVIPDKARYW
ncbi:HIT family protein [Planctomycetes bacterium TBK1r]|uniref:AP-4-A phosphorylase n=1 Tax=Stieleria magnilauensis TaxID=2527963 RepID=A0ABX5XUX3_9BACT|nr:AP-4-A phosphorylase [Planctomycetes bacterium TBK1r]